MALLGKKEKKEETASPAEVPVEKVLQMRQHGMTNNQIVQTLQRDGYRTSQIFDAMNQADLSTGAPQQKPMQQDIGPTFDEAMETPEQETAMPTQMPEERADYSEQIEELAEAIIEEKWQELMKDINKIIEWKNAMEERTAKLEQKFEDLQKNYEALQKGVLSKVGEYDRNIKDVGTEIKAMEQVFKKVLPTFTANVNELSRITKGIKKKKTK